MADIMCLLKRLKEVDQYRILFGEKLRSWREDIGMTQEEFAKKCGMSRQALFQYESHPDEFQKGISLKRIEAFLKVFSEKLQRKISPEDFLRDIVVCD